MSMLVLGNALDVLRAMPDESVDEFATSPPYFRQRDYGVADRSGMREGPTVL